MAVDELKNMIDQYGKLQFEMGRLHADIDHRLTMLSLLQPEVVRSFSMPSMTAPPPEGIERPLKKRGPKPGPRGNSQTSILAEVMKDGVERGSEDVKILLAKRGIELDQRGVNTLLSNAAAVGKIRRVQVGRYVGVVQEQTTS